MQSALTVLTPAEEIALVSLYEAKVALNILPSVSTSDEMIQTFIDWSSAEAATFCNRVFAKEKVEETFTELGFNSRIYLSRYPVRPEEIVSITEAGVPVPVSNYLLDGNSGTLTRRSGMLSVLWGGPVTVIYSGGYKLPFEAPLALRQAVHLITKEAYFAATRGDASVRMVAHKESRVMYFDPNQRGSSGGAAAGSPARRAVNDLLRRFMRVPI